MFISHFYSISAILVTLGLLKLFLVWSRGNTLITVLLSCALSFIAFENSLTFFPIVSYLLRDQIQFFFLFLKKSFNSLKKCFPFTGNQTEKENLSAEKTLIAVRKYGEDLEEKAKQCESLPRQLEQYDALAPESAENGKVFEKIGLGSISEKPLNNEGKPSLSKTSSTSDNELPSSPTVWSPLERGIVEKDRHLQLFNFSVGTGIVLAICRGCIDVVRRLDYTQKWVKEMTDKGFPRWLFFWVPDSNPETFPEKSLFSFLVRIFVLNLVILYVLFHFL